ncbi:hypothetical protein CVT24_003936 [Panaeolus cyanescens]|uniref:CBM1 domain-containing protein n=1 Tax=Panaeolus cyanescens TaxID=181874 RepID=A0A409Y6L9_9AGAR|nr:hypothetical protein CVT24_003936 [Panaeolus cyanescens]
MLLKISLLVSLVSAVVAQSPAWGQCGGQGWSGSTTCVSGYTCTYSNPYYSQCLPGSAPPGSTSSTPAPTSTTTTRGTTTTPATTTTASGPAGTGYQIRAVQAPVYHFYLQSNGGVPQLGPEASAARFSIGGTISLNQANGSKLYLNVDMSASTSYKPLSFAATATTTNWGLEGDTIITTNPRQLNFIACSTSNANFYDLFLQTGNDSPSGRSCSLQTIHLPCLC